MAKLKPCLIWIILLLQLFCVASDKSNPKIKELFQGNLLPFPYLKEFYYISSDLSNKITRVKKFGGTPI